jgi:anti-anti-sigma factor
MEIPMDIKTLSFSSDTLTVQPDCGALVARNAATFAVAVLPLLRRGMCLEVDLSSVNYIDGAGVGALVTCRHAMQREGCTLVLTQVQTHIRQELEACGLQALLVRSDAIDLPISLNTRWAH